MISISHGALVMVLTDKKIYRKLIWCLAGMSVWGPNLHMQKCRGPEWTFYNVEHILLWHELSKVIWFVSQWMQSCGLRLGECVQDAQILHYSGLILGGVGVFHMEHWSWFSSTKWPTESRFDPWDVCVDSNFSLVAKCQDPECTISFWNIHCWHGL